MWVKTSRNKTDLLITKNPFIFKYSNFLLYSLAVKSKPVVFDLECIAILTVKQLIFILIFLKMLHGSFLKYD